MQHYNSISRLRSDSVTSIVVPNWFFSLKRTKKSKQNRKVSRSAWDLPTLTGDVKKVVGNLWFNIIPIMFIGVL